MFDLIMTPMSLSRNQDALALVRLQTNAEEIRRAGKHLQISTQQTATTALGLAAITPLAAEG
jgi:hypothetical protein